MISTGHEHIDEVGLVHMNGRVYDSTLGRFISADPTIQAPYNSQSFNRYSYVLNNPLSYTDPSGFSFLSNAFKKFRNAIKKVFRGIRNFWKSVLKNEVFRIVATIGLSFVGVPPGVWSAMMKGFAIGFVGSGGDFKAGVIGALTGAAFHGIGEGFAGKGKIVTNAAGKAVEKFSAGVQALKTVAHGVVGGLASVANGGQFKSGFLAGGFAEGFSDVAGDLAPQTSNAINPGQVVIAATIGGAGSVLGGGKFANGAVTGAFSNVFNEQGHGDLLRSYEDKYPNGNSEIRPMEGAAGEWKYEKIIAISDVPTGMSTIKNTVKEYGIKALQAIDLVVESGSRYVAEYTPNQFYTYDVYIDRVTLKPTTERFNIQNTTRIWKQSGRAIRQEKLRVCTGGSLLCIN